MKRLRTIIGGLLVIVALLFLPTNVNAKEMSDEFKSLLTEDGKLKVNGAKPSDRGNFEFLFEYLFLTDENGEYANTGNSWDNVSDDMNTVDFTINAGKANEETFTVGIEYIYDEDIKKMIDGYVSKIPANLEYFNIRDMEVINFWVNGKGEYDKLINYSGELKQYFDYKNFGIDLRKGSDGKFQTEASGIANFSYNNTIYGMRDNTGVMAKHIIYVDENAGTTKEEITNAVQKRIDDYIGKGKVNVLFGGDSVYDLHIDEFDADIKNYEDLLAATATDLEIARQNEQTACANGYTAECTQAQSERVRLDMELFTVERYLESARSYKDYFIDEYNSEDGEYHFLKNALNDWYFIAEVTSGDSSSMYHFIVEKDSSKMVLPITKTSDAKTDITISTSNTQVPLDTTISAEQLTSGSEYERIVKLLNLTDNVTFDLKLYSNSLGTYVTQLSDGTFEVKIPVPEDFNGKDLVVYYVGSNNEPEVYEVNVEDGYAIFNTNHFSIYTLGYKSSTQNTPTLENPNTFDGIGNSIFIGTISFISLIGITLYLKKRNKENA